MSKNKKVMSIAILPELHEELRKLSKRKGISASTYVGNLVEQAVKLNPDDDPVIFGKPSDEDVSPVVLKVPSSLLNNFDKFKSWLDVQTAGILKAMVKE
jgi:hypothetical protein